jgi:glutamine synthetase
MMEEDFYAVIKLISGEEIFSIVCPSEENDKTILILNNPVTIEVVVMKQIGMQGYKIDPWLKFADDDMFVITMDKVLTISEVNDEETIEMYHKYVKQKENKNSKNTLTPEMGYLSSVSEARKSLEKLYKKESDIKDS